MSLQPQARRFMIRLMRRSGCCLRIESVNRYSHVMFEPSTRSLIRESSSRNVTSRLQWHVFSIDLSYCPPSDKLCERGTESHGFAPLSNRTNEINHHAALVFAIGPAAPDDSIVGGILSTPAGGPTQSRQPTLPRDLRARPTAASGSSLSFAIRATCASIRPGSPRARATT